MNLCRPLVLCAAALLLAALVVLNFAVFRRALN